MSASTTNGLHSTSTEVPTRENKVTNEEQNKMTNEEQNERQNGEEKKNNWTGAGVAALDFRSDVVTCPTPSMLSAIQQASLLDDVFQEDTSTNSLESFISSLTGYEASLLVLSGTMGNQLSLRTHLGGPPHSILTDYRSHILEYEAGGAASLCGALVKGVRPANRHHLTLRDIKKHATLSENVHACPTKVISLENTLAGTVLPLKDCREIAAWARSHGIVMHLDGARLWEAVAAETGSLKEYCACFDSVSLCFSKGLGAPIGSVITGSAAFVKRARWIRKSIGGGLRQAGVVAAPARVAVEDTFLGGKLKGSHDMARRLESMWVGKGGKLAQPVETNMVWFDLRGYALEGESSGDDDDQEEDEEDGDVWRVPASSSRETPGGLEKTDFASLAAKHGLKCSNRGRLVVHYQIGEEALMRLEKVMDELVLRRKVVLASVTSPPLSNAGGAANTTTATVEANGSVEQVQEVKPQPDRAMG